MHFTRHNTGGRTSAVGVRSRTTCGVPVLSSLFSSPLFLVPYAIGFFKFFAGYSRTTYVNNLPTKLALAAAWCARGARVVSAHQHYALKIMQPAGKRWPKSTALMCSIRRVIAGLFCSQSQRPTVTTSLAPSRADLPPPPLDVCAHKQISQHLSTSPRPAGATCCENRHCVGLLLGGACCVLRR